MKLINIGFGNMVSAGRVVAVVSPDSAPVKRLVKEARERGMLIDASYGRSTRAHAQPYHAVQQEQLFRMAACQMVKRPA